MKSQPFALCDCSVQHVHNSFWGSTALSIVRFSGMIGVEGVLVVEDNFERHYAYTRITFLILFLTFLNP